jgi:Bacterial inner membrane protein
MLTHFALIGATSGSAVMGVAGVQALLAIPLGKHPKFRRIYFVSLLLTPLVCGLTWLGPESVFSSAAMGIFAFANLQTDQLKQRTLLIIAIGAWFAHNYITHSTPGLVSNTLALIISVRMLYVLHKEAQQPLK